MKKKLFAIVMLCLAMTSFVFTSCEPDPDPDGPAIEEPTNESPILGSWQMTQAMMITDQGPQDYTSFYGTLILDFKADGTVDMRDNISLTTWNWRVDENNNLVFFHPNDANEINWMIQVLTENYMKLHYNNNGTEMEMDFDRIAK